MDSRTGRNNKMRGKVYERKAAEVLGGNRVGADQGGKLDLENVPGGLAVQVKSGATVVSQVAVTGLRAAQAGAAPGMLPCVVLFDRRHRPGEGNRLGQYIMFDLHEYAAWNGHPGPTPEADEALGD